MSLSQVQFRPNGTGIWWRNLPVTQECTLSATTLQPDTINDNTIKLMCEPPLELVKVEGSRNQLRITIGLTWEPPVRLYGGYKYEVLISDRHVDSRDGINNPFRHEVVRLTHFVRVRLSN